MSASSDPILLSKEQASRLLGFSVKWLEEQIKAGAPCLRIGRTIRLRRADVESFARDSKWPTRTYVNDNEPKEGKNS